MAVYNNMPGSFELVYAPTCPQRLNRCSFIDKPMSLCHINRALCTYLGNLNRTIYCTVLFFNILYWICTVLNYCVQMCCCFLSAHVGGIGSLQNLGGPCLHPCISIEIAITNISVVILIYLIIIYFWPQWRNLHSSRLLFLFFFYCSSLEHFLSKYCNHNLYFQLFQPWGIFFFTFFTSTLENSFNLRKPFFSSCSSSWPYHNGSLIVAGYSVCCLCLLSVSVVCVCSFS